MNITADGQAVPVPSYQNTKNTVYPAAFNSNLLYMGCFEPGETVLRFMSASSLSEDSFTLTALDKGKVNNFYADAAYDPDTTVETDEDSILLTLTAEGENRSLFLPITYSSRWQCTVNGQEVSPSRVMGVLMSLPLQSGKNEIVLTQGAYPSSFSQNDAIALVFFAVCLAWLILSRRSSGLRNLQLPAWVYIAVTVLFYLVCATILAFIYIVPTVFLITQGTIVGF